MVGSLKLSCGSTELTAAVGLYGIQAYDDSVLSTTGDRSYFPQSRQVVLLKLLDHWAESPKGQYGR